MNRKALDAFLEEDSWDSAHWADKNRFFLAIDKLARDRAFDADQVGEYVAQRWSEQYGTTMPECRRKYYADAPQAVHDYMRAIGGLTE